LRARVERRSLVRFEREEVVRDRADHPLVPAATSRDRCAPYFEADHVDDAVVKLARRRDPVHVSPPAAKVTEHDRRCRA